MHKVCYHFPHRRSNAIWKFHVSFTSADVFLYKVFFLYFVDFLLHGKFGDEVKSSHTSTQKTGVELHVSVQFCKKKKEWRERMIVSEKNGSYDNGSGWKEKSVRDTSIVVVTPKCVLKKASLLLVRISPQLYSGRHYRIIIDIFQPSKKGRKLEKYKTSQSLWNQMVCSHHYTTRCNVFSLLLCIEFSRVFSFLFSLFIVKTVFYVY